jgi:3-hydroxyisobutyrate dehydrogenase-like beta-hydroxyacid dehydrogenase
MIPTAFLGLGVMGGGMAGRLLDAGVPLAVWNRHSERAAPLVARGARLATSPLRAVSDHRIIGTPATKPRGPG